MPCPCSASATANATSARSGASRFAVEAGERDDPAAGLGDERMSPSPSAPMSARDSRASVSAGRPRKRKYRLCGRQRSEKRAATPRRPRPFARRRQTVEPSRTTHIGRAASGCHRSHGLHCIASHRLPRGRGQAELFDPVADLVAIQVRAASRPASGCRRCARSAWITRLRSSFSRSTPVAGSSNSSPALTALVIAAKVARIEPVAVRQQHRALDHVAQLAHVARPAVALQQRVGGRRRAEHASSGTRVLKPSMKYSTSSGMSSGCARSGGIAIGSTFRRKNRSARNLCLATSSSRLRLVAAITRTSTRMSCRRRRPA